MAKNGAERSYTRKRRGRQDRNSQMRGLIAHIREKLREERRVRKEKTEE